MTQQEFIRGWKLLIIQPWGWRYRSLTDASEPSEESMTQMSFYYDTLKWAHGEAWWKVASNFAQGEEWPSLNALIPALQVINARYVPAIGQSRHVAGVSMEEALSEKPELLAMVKQVIAGETNVL